MIATELINDSYPPLKTSDTGLKAIRWMDNFKLEHIPVVHGRKYVGLITESDVLRLGSMERPIGEMEGSLHMPFIKATKPVFEIVKIMSKDRLSAIPVVDDEMNYLGLIRLNDLLRYYRDSGIFEESTGVVVLRMPLHDYSLSKLAHLVEAEDATVLSAFMTNGTDDEMVEVTMRINQEDLSRILASFSRYGYIIKEHYSQGKLGDELKDRYDALIKYLET